LFLKSLYGFNKLNRIIYKLFILGLRITNLKIRRLVATVYKGPSVISMSKVHGCEWRLTVVLWVNSVAFVEHTSKCDSIFKGEWSIQLVLMFLSVILQMGMREQPADFVTATWRRDAYIRWRIFRGRFADLLSTVKWARWAMNPSRRIRLYISVLYYCDEVDCLFFASLFAIC